MLAYCDYVAKLIQDKFAAMSQKPELRAPVVNTVSRIQWDLDANGAFVSTKKTIRVKVEGKWYVVTVEEEV